MISFYKEKDNTNCSQKNKKDINNLYIASIKDLNAQMITAVRIQEEYSVPQAALSQDTIMRILYNGFPDFKLFDPILKPPSNNSLLAFNKIKNYNLGLK